MLGGRRRASVLQDLSVGACEGAKPSREAVLRPARQLGLLPVPTPFPLHGLLYAPASDSRTRPGTWLPGGVPRDSTLKVIVVKIDGAGRP